MFHPGSFMLRNFGVGVMGVRWVPLFLQSKPNGPSKHLPNINLGYLWYTLSLGSSDAVVGSMLCSIKTFFNSTSASKYRRVENGCYSPILTGWVSSSHLLCLCEHTKSKLFIRNPIIARHKFNISVLLALCILSSLSVILNSFLRIWVIPNNHFWLLIPSAYMYKYNVACDERIKRGRGEIILEESEIEGTLLVGNLSLIAR